MQFHILSFEGPDPYSRAGGLASRVEGLAGTLAGLGFETHLWYIGDPAKPGDEKHGCLHIHRWCQWVSQYHPGGVYDGELGKQAEYSASLPPYLLEQILKPHITGGGRAVVLAEEWQTVDAVLHLDWLLRYAGFRDRVTMLWNANNTFGFEGIPWAQLNRAATITTVSRYMKHRMADLGVEALVIPNGLDPESFQSPGRSDVAALRKRFRDRTLLAKMARWDPDKRWLATIDIVAETKRQGWRPLLIARGGSEPHGADVLRAAQSKGLRVVERTWKRPGPAGLIEALGEVGDADIVNLRSFVDPGARRVLLRGADVVLANSSHEPFGLVGLETMAAGGLACTGATGEDYAVSGQNAIVVETSDPREFTSLLEGLHANPDRAQRLRRAGKETARRYTWRKVLESVLLPRVEFSQSIRGGGTRDARARPVSARALNASRARPEDSISSSVVDIRRVQLG